MLRKSLMAAGMVVVFCVSTWAATILLPDSRANGFNKWDLAIGIGSTLVACLTAWSSTGAAGNRTRLWLRLRIGSRRTTVTAGGNIVQVAGSVLVAVVALVVLAVVVLGATRSPQASSHAPAAPAPSATPALRAVARWCCKLVDNATTDTFYWPHSAAALTAAEKDTSPTALAGLVPVGGASIEVAVQGGLPAAVLLQRLHVHIRSRDPNPRTGMIVTIPCECGAGGSVRELDTDLDQPVPAIRPHGGGNPDIYLYVTQDKPEVMLVNVSDRSCDCVFDLELDWLADGRSGQTILDNDGQHFHVIGTAGLPRRAA